MQRALGEGPEALALVLVALWLSAIVALPLEHALVHATSDTGHCHADAGALVCHGQDGSEAPAVSDASLPVLGDLSLAHGALAVLAAPALAVLPPACSSLSIVTPPELISRASDGHRGAPNARGPPDVASLG